MYQSACEPLVMNVLVPLILQAEPLRTAVVRIWETSEPASCPVRPLEASLGF